MITQKEYSWNEQHYTRLLGHKVVAVGFMEELNELWPYMTFESPKGERVDVHIHSDPEGNHPGFLFYGYMELPEVNNEQS